METLDTTAVQGAAGMHLYDTLLAEQAGLIDVPLLVEALSWLGVSTPEGPEVAAARVGHLTNYLIRQVLHGKDQHRQRASEARSMEAQRGAGQQGNYSPAELRAFNTGWAFAERMVRAEQNARRLILARLALDGLIEDSSHAAAQQTIKFLYPDLADLADQDPALARRALNALQPD